MGFLADFSLGGGRDVLGLLLSGERGRLRVPIVEALRICGGAPGCDKQTEEARNACLLEFMEG